MFWQLFQYSIFSWVIITLFNIDAYRRSFVVSETYNTFKESLTGFISYYRKYALNYWIYLFVSLGLTVSVTHIINQGGVFVLLEIPAFHIPVEYIEKLKARPELYLTIGKITALASGFAIEFLTNLYRRWKNPIKA